MKSFYFKSIFSYIENMNLIRLIACSAPLILNAFSWDCGWEAEARLAAFCPSSSRFTQVYGSAAIDYELQVSKEMTSYIDSWAGVSALAKSGLSYASGLPGVENSTRVWMETMDAGLNLKVYFLRHLEAYAGLGAAYTFLHIHNNDPYLPRSFADNGWGFLSKLGFKYYYRHIIVDIFADYLYAPLHFSGTDVSVSSMNIGGWKIGGGLGIRF